MSVVITTDTTRTIQSDGNWAKRSTSTQSSIPDGTPLGEEIYLRALQYAKETISIYNALYSFDGAISTETYNQMMADLNENMQEMERRFKIQTYTLVIVEDLTIVDSIGNIKTKALLNEMCITKLGCTADNILNNEYFKIPPKYKNSKILVKSWLNNMSDVTTTIKQGT